MDIFYEESAVNNNATRGGKTYNVLNVFSKIFLTLALIFLVGALMNIPVCSPGTLTPEQQEAWEMLRFLFFGGLFGGTFFLLLFFYFSYAKSLCNVSYDYVFVTGELRISKVFNVNRRKLVALVESGEMLSIGRVESDSYERLNADPSVKEVVCTPNKEKSEGKDFIYVLSTHNGKTMYIIECRELLVANMMKFVKRTVLASDYTSSKRG